MAETSVTTSSEIPQLRRRQSSFDEETMTKLEKSLSQRPEKSELQERNILKDDSVAPRLQAAKEALAKSQLHDKLGHAIQQRPSPDDLVRNGILPEDGSPTSE